MPKPRRKIKPLEWAIYAFVLFAVLFAGYNVWTYRDVLFPQPIESRASEQSSEESSSISSQSLSSDSSALNQEIWFPTDQILETTQRKDYEEGSLTLTIARLGISQMPVVDGVDDESLAESVGLHPYSCLPGEAENANVTIAGHRDIYGMEFYYIDTITEGDTIILEFQGMRYTYVYKETFIVDPEEERESSIVLCRDAACVTIFSCDPIGTSLRRMVVVAELDDVSKIRKSR